VQTAPITAVRSLVCHFVCFGLEEDEKADRKKTDPENGTHCQRGLLISFLFFEMFFVGTTSWLPFIQSSSQRCSTEGMFWTCKPKTSKMI